MSESTHIRTLAVDAVDAAAELMARPIVGERWNEPSALDGMTVGRTGDRPSGLPVF